MPTDRAELNFSTGDLDVLAEAAEQVHEGEMPPWFYRLLHAGAHMDTADQEALLSGLRSTIGLRFDEDRVENGEHGESYGDSEAETDD